MGRTRLCGDVPRTKSREQSQTATTPLLTGGTASARLGSVGADLMPMGGCVCVGRMGGGHQAKGLKGGMRTESASRRQLGNGGEHSPVSIPSPCARATLATSTASLLAHPSTFPFPCGAVQAWGPRSTGPCWLQPSHQTPLGEPRCHRPPHRPLMRVPVHVPCPLVVLLGPVLVQLAEATRHGVGLWWGWRGAHAVV